MATRWGWVLGLGVLCLGCDGTGECEPETDLEFCFAAGKNCGEYTGFDRCGASRTVACGTCELPQMCAGGGVANVCGDGDADAGAVDGGGRDAGSSDGGPGDAGAPDAGPGATLSVELTFESSAGMFAPLSGETVACTVDFSSPMMATPPSAFPLTVSPAAVSCDGTTSAFAARIEAGLAGGSVRLDVFGAGGAVVNRTRVQLEGAPGAEIFRIDSTCDEEGFPSSGGELTLANFVCDSADRSGAADLYRYTGTVTPGGQTDQAHANSVMHRYVEP